MPPPRFERRIGQRLPVEPVATLVDVESQQRFRRRLTTLDFVLVEVSITGAKLVGPAHPALVTGAAIRVRVPDAGAATATVRRRGAGDPAVYGVEILVADVEFRDFVSRRVAANRGDVELAWRLAR